MNREKIFIDTSAYLAWLHANDGQHNTSKSIWKKLKKEKHTLITTNHVLDELATLLGRRTSYEYSARKMRQIYSSEIVITRPDENDEKMALNFFEKYADKKITFTDCLSFVVMNRLKIRKVFTFDSDFSYPGFEIIPPLYLS